MNTSKSEQLFEKARSFFPGGVNSPVRAFRSVGGTPIFIDKGKGPLVWDADGNEYVDFCCSWGPLILGHADEEVLNAVYETMKAGTSFGAPTKLENELAGLIISNNRFIEKMRFVSSGTEAVMSAIRLARGFTGRNKILKFEGCYHGHVDALLVKAGSGLVTLGNSSSAGIPEAFVKETLSVPLNDESALLKAFESHGKDLAAVIIEPMPANNGLLLQRREFLLKLRELCSSNGTLLIFDEVISGFRLGFEGAAGYYNIQPDIITYGKIIGGGFPVGAYASSAAVMSRVSPEGDVYQAGTLSGNPVAMRAGIAQLSQCLKPGFYERLAEQTKYLTEGIRAVTKQNNYRLFSQGSVFWGTFTTAEHVRSADEIDPALMEHFKALYHHLLKNGIYFGPSGYEVGFVSAAHEQKHLDKCISAFGSFFSEMK